MCTDKSNIEGIYITLMYILRFRAVIYYSEFHNVEIKN